jgi:tetratricopeptide (TPR) repeat protein
MTVFTIPRWLLAFGCFYFVFKMMTAALKMGGFGAAGYLIIAFASLISGILFISPEIVTRFAALCSQILTSIVFPDARYDKPRLSYILARSYSKQMRYSESCEEYKRIIHYYPHEETAYIELIALLDKNGEKKLAIRYRKYFKRRFQRDPVITLSQHTSIKITES